MSYLTRLSLVLLGSACIPAGSETETSSESGATTSGSTGPATTTMVPVCEGEGDWHAPSDGSGDGGDSSSGDSPVGMGDDMPLAASVPEIQQGTIAIDTLVLLEGVVVTTPRATREGGEPGEQLVFVQDPAGGPWSGLRVHLLSPDPSPMTTVPLMSRLSNCSRIWNMKTPRISMPTSTSRAMPSSTTIGMP